MSDHITIKRYNNSMDIYVLGDVPRHVWLWVNGQIDITVSMNAGEMRRLAHMMLAKVDEVETAVDAE